VVNETMSYRAVFFAIPQEETSEVELVRRLVSATFTPRTWSTIERVRPVYASPDLVPAGSQHHAYVAISSDVDARRSGLRYFLLGLDDGVWDYWYKFELANFLEALAPWTVVTLSHDDQQGVFFFERRSGMTPKLAWLLTVGAHYGGSTARFTVDFPQKRFSTAQLSSILEKPEASMSREERAAVIEHDDAITIGLRQFYPRARYAEYIDLLYADRVWMFNRQDAPVLVPRPKAFRPFVTRVPSGDQIRRAKLGGHAREMG
jgi:hypothetical protein